VLDGLKDAGLTTIHEKFKAFCEVVPKVRDEGELVLPLRNGLVRRRDSEVLDKLELKSETSWNGDYHMKVTNNAGNDERLTLNKKMDGLAYLQVRDELLERLPEFEAALDERIRSVKGMFEKLQALFSRELMMAEL
jgi:hypothetical protein